MGVLKPSLTNLSACIKMWPFLTELLQKWFFYQVRWKENVRLKLTFHRSLFHRLWNCGWTLIHFNKFKNWPKTSCPVINPFYAIGLFLYPLKTWENQRFSDVVRGYRKRPVIWNGSNQNIWGKLTLMECVNIKIFEVNWPQLHYTKNEVFH